MRFRDSAFVIAVAGLAVVACGEGPRTERWVEVEVEEAYIHCAKHLPHLVKVPRKRAWGSDDPKRKGGDFFEAACEARPWSTPT